MPVFCLAIAMSDNDADRLTNNDESTHLLSRDIVTSHGVDRQPNSECFQSSTVAKLGGDGGDILKGRRSSNGSLHSRPGIQRSLSGNAKRPSMDGGVQIDDQSTEVGSHASLLHHQSPISKTNLYGTLYSPPSPVRQRLSTLRRLSFAEVVEPITLTWENIDVYAPPATSKPIVLRGLCASSVNSDNVQPKHILKDGTSAHFSRI